MNIYFTSGEICSIFNIPKQTLLYYDKIDLIKPDHINENTSYRYYSIEQFSYLYLILALKTSGIELKKIKKYLSKHSILETKNLLNSQVMNLDNKIRELQHAKETLNNTLKQIEYGSLTTNKTFGHSYFQQKYLYALAIDETDITNDFSLTFTKLLRKYNFNYSSLKMQYGWIVSLKPTGEFKSRSIYIELDNPEPSICNNLIVKPKGDYLCTFHKGDYSKLSNSRNELLNYAFENNMTIKGYIYERQIINKFITDNQNEFITEISIAID